MEQRKKNECHPEWRELPHHITEMIADRLSFPDILRFASVCETWRWVAAEISRRRRLCSYQFQPLVMFDYNFEKGICGFFNFQESRVYWINIPEAPAKRCLGCSQAWLVLLDPCVALSFLLNPFTKTRIYLPNFEDAHFLNFEKVILFPNPIDHISMEINKHCLVVALDTYMQLFFCRLGDKSWRSMPLNPHGKTPFLGSLVFYRGQLYSLSEKGKLWVRNLTVEGLSGNASKCRVAFPVNVFDDDVDDSIECYLVESQGNLLLVIRFINKEPRRTLSFLIFMLLESNDSNDPNGSYVWERQMNLDDDQTLFVSRYCSKSVSLSSREYVGLQGNSIYFTDDVYYQFEKREYPEMGIYHIDDGRVERCLPLDLYPFENLSIWITPSI
ncbi:putative F-box protein At4g22180 [Telopea speciosissima]|uniref:putative F-box protein At4g22180 n=1 Tax=Telopea speciosissima TaxID=54955 RepID=UPI001CC7E2F3|nr:putative F-box protein At4g22180 [Telopea speciosissima]XP_043715918.1 putative F-box protein At4g22180 [Telopea speciosissima]